MLKKALFESANKRGMVACALSSLITVFAAGGVSSCLATSSAQSEIRRAFRNAVEGLQPVLCRSVADALSRAGHDAFLGAAVCDVLTDVISSLGASRSGWEDETKQE